MSAVNRVSVRTTENKPDVIKHDADGWSIDGDGNLHISQNQGPGDPPVGEFFTSGDRRGNTVIAVYSRGAWASVTLVRATEPE